MVVTKKSRDEALKIVDSVFEKCYNDLEPYGRKILTESDYKRAYEDNKQVDYLKFYKKSV